MFKAIIKPVFLFVITVFSVSTLQWCCIQFMAHFCHELTLWGLVKNIFTLGSPICNFVNHIQIKLTDHYILIWVTAISVIISYIKCQ